MSISSTRDLGHAITGITRQLRESNPGPRPSTIHTEVVTVRRQGARPMMMARSTTDQEQNYAAHWRAYETLPINGFTYAATLHDGRKVTVRLDEARTFKQAYEMGRAAVARKKR